MNNSPVFKPGFSFKARHGNFRVNSFAEGKVELVNLHNGIRITGQYSKVNRFINGRAGHAAINVC